MICNIFIIQKAPGTVLVELVRQMQRVQQRGMELVGDVVLQSHLPGETRHHIRLVRMPAARLTNDRSLACGNRPPYEAFPELPALPYVPDSIDPDAWLTHYHRRIFKRRVGSNGMVSVGNRDYDVDYRLAGERVGVFLDAELRVFHILHKDGVLRELEIADS
jgi:hypothetical protein